MTQRIQNYRRRKRPVYRRRIRRVMGSAREPSWGQVGTKVLKTVGWLKGLVNAEHKYAVTNSSGGVDYSGTLLSLCAPSQGDGATNRDGDSIKMKNLSLKGQLYNNSQAGTFRMIIFIDKGNLISAASDLLGASVGTATAPFEIKNQNNKYNVITLYDGMYQYDSASNVIQNLTIPNLKIEHHCQFQAGSTTLESNALKVLLISSSTTTNPTFTGIFRVSFVDN